MLIIPAIDLRGGRCVRLRQGDYDRETVFSDDPAAMARHWVSEGATYLHVVDLDGAREGRPVNREAIRAIVQTAGVPCQLGGGLRNESDLQAAFEVGLDRLIIGTQALKSPDWVVTMCAVYPGKLMLGIDAKRGLVAGEGWYDVSHETAIDLARNYEHQPLAGIVYTDIDRDGMMQGPNLGAIFDLATSVPFPVIASGGVTTLDDVRRLNELPIAGYIVGRALYEGTLNLREAINLQP